MAASDEQKPVTVLFAEIGATGWLAETAHPEQEAL